MTPYQRGARDALLALAVELERAASAEEADYPLGHDYRIGSAKHQAAIGARWRSGAAMAAAAIARRRAEALPHDPEETTP